MVRTRSSLLRYASAILLATACVTMCALPYSAKVCFAEGFGAGVAMDGQNACCEKDEQSNDHTPADLGAGENPTCECCVISVLIGIASSKSILESQVHKKTPEPRPDFMLCRSADFSDTSFDQFSPRTRGAPSLGSRSTLRAIRTVILLI